MIAALLIACAPHPAPAPAAGAPAAGASAATAPRPRDDGGPPIRVALAISARGGVLSATGAYRVHDARGAVLAKGNRDDSWTVEWRAGRARVVRRDDGVAGAWRREGFVLRPATLGALVGWEGKRYRGEIAVTPTDSGVLVVNRLPMEEYLRAVVPAEIGPRPAAERAAAEAQAVAARSYALVRLVETSRRAYDLSAGIYDQVYGGVAAERAVTDAAVAATDGLVLTFAGRVVSAPYHSTCGGQTAEAPEAWRTRGEPFLRRVSDRIPGSDGYYCDRAPRFRWERTIDGDVLAANVERYLRTYAEAPAGALGDVRAVRVEGTTPSGRAAAVVFATERGTYRVRANDARLVLRSSGGEPLNSTYFSIEPVVGRGGRLTQLTVRGTGYGHGVGMCQWGAIGRARAGQDFRTILATYFPGTRVEYRP